MFVHCALKGVHPKLKISLVNLMLTDTTFDLKKYILVNAVEMLSIVRAVHVN